MYSYSNWWWWFPSKELHVIHLYQLWLLWFWVRPFLGVLRCKCLNLGSSIPSARRRHPICYEEVDCPHSSKKWRRSRCFTASYIDSYVCLLLYPRCFWFHMVSANLDALQLRIRCINAWNHHSWHIDRTWWHRWSTVQACLWCLGLLVLSHVKCYFLCLYIRNSNNLHFRPKCPLDFQR